MRSTNRRLLERVFLYALAAPFGAVGRIGDSSGLVGLTFDDGPDQHLPMFLEALEKAGVRATFFVVGEQVESWPGGLQRIIAAGHEVGVHGYRHLPYPRRHAFDAAEDLHRARVTIEDAGGVRPRLFRPPYGLFSRAVARSAAREDLEKVLWSRTGFDWGAKATPESVAANVGFPEDGGIVLLHDSEAYAAPGSHRSSLGALTTIIERVDAAGPRFATVSEMLMAE